MADPRVVVAGLALQGRYMSTVGVEGATVATAEDHAIAGGGALGAVAAATAGGPVRVHVDLAARVGDDPAGTWLLAELIGRGVDVSGLSRWGRTGERIAMRSDAGEPQVVLVPGEVDAAGVPDLLRRCAPGDVLLLDAFLLAHHPELVDAAYDLDVQVVADASPVIPEALSADLSRVDVVVVDTAGAGVLADSATQPPSVAVHGGAIGSWWDDMHLPPTEADERVPLWARRDHGGVHRFAGALAAGLACGLDRPEAFALAVTTARERVEG